MPSNILLSVNGRVGESGKGKSAAVDVSLYGAGMQESNRLLSFNVIVGEQASVPHQVILAEIPEEKMPAFQQAKLGIKFQVNDGTLVSTFDPLVYAPFPAEIVVEVESSASLRIHCEESRSFQFGELYIGSVALSPRSGRTDPQNFPKNFTLTTEGPIQIDGLTAGEYIVTLGDEDLSYSFYQVAFAVRGETTDVVFPAPGIPVQLAGRCQRNSSGDTDLIVAIRGTGANVGFQAEAPVDKNGNFQSEVPSDGEYFACLLSKQQLGISRVKIPFEQQFLVPPDVSNFDLTLNNGVGSVTVQEIIATESVCSGGRIFLTLDLDSSGNVQAWNSIVSDVVASGVLDPEGQCSFHNVPAGDYRLEFAPGGRQLRMPLSQFSLKDTAEEHIRFDPPRPHPFSISIWENGGELDLNGFASSPLLLKSGNELAAEKLISIWSRVTGDSGANSSWAPAFFEIGKMPGEIELVGPGSGQVELFIRVLDAGIAKSVRLGPIHFPHPRPQNVVAELVRSSGIRVRAESVSGLVYPFHIFIQDGVGRRLPFFGGSNFQKFEHYIPGLPPGEYGIEIVTSGQAVARKRLELSERDEFLIMAIN